MKFAQAGALAAFLVFAGLLSGCVGGNANTNINQPASGLANSSQAETNLEKLRLVVNVPYETEDVAWREDTAARKVIAVMRFSSGDANKIVSEAEKLAPPQAVALPVESWFPGELVAQGEMSGDGSLKGLSYVPAEFYHEPYNGGRITRIESSDYFVLELSVR